MNQYNLYMRPVRIAYNYPQKNNGEYKTVSASFEVSNENIFRVVGEPNAIDCVCDAMKLVLIEKKEKQISERMIKLFDDLDEYDEFVNNTIIFLFKNGIEETKNDFVGSLERIDKDSFELSERFRKIYYDRD